MSNARDKANIPSLNFSSTGIDDNATSTAITINSSQHVELHGGQIESNNNTSSITYSGGDNSNAGANLTLFGGSHATTPNVDRFRRSATEVMRITSSGNVGIGTSSPTQALSIASVSSTPGDYKGLAFQSGGTEVSYVRSNCTNGNNYFLTFGTFALGLAERMRIDGNGQVGIGITPNLSGKRLYIDSTGFCGVELSESGTRTGQFGYDPVNNWLSVGTLQSEPLRFTTGSTERMRIDSSGNVGIGETAPLGKLHVKTADTGATSVSSNANELVIENTGNVGITLQSDNSGTGNLYFGDVANGSIGRVSYDHSSNFMSFNTNAAERMRINSSGNVGINTTNTDTKFSLESPAKISRSAATTVDASNLTNKFELLKFTLAYGFQPPAMITGTLMVSVVNSRTSFNGQFGFRSTHIDFTFCSGQGYASNGFEVLQAINTLSNSAVNATHSPGRLTALTVTAEVSYDGGSTFGTSFGVAQSSSTPTPIVRLVANTTRSNTDASRLGLNYKGTYSYNDLCGGGTASPVLLSDAITNVT